MGTSAVGLGLHAYQQGQQEAFQRSEEQRVAGRNAQAALIENALNNPDTKPADRANLLAQHAALFQPHEAPDLFQRLSGLIHGQKTAASTTPAQPTSSAAPTMPDGTAGPQVPGAAPPAEPPKDFLGIPITDPNVAAAHAEPMHPMATSHPILDRFHEGLDALGHHLKGFAQPVAPNPQEAQNNSDVLARNYQSPITTQRESADLAGERAQELARAKNENQISVAEIRAGGVRGTLNNSGAQSLATAQSLHDNGQRYVDFATGKDIDLDALAERVPDAKLVPYTQGSRLLGYQIADQKGRIITADNLKKPVGEFATLLHEPTVGVARTGTENDSTATAGNGQQVLTGTHTSTPIVPANAVPQPPTATPQPPTAAVPTLQRRTAPPLANVNAQIAAANASSPRLNKGKPTAPTAPTQPISANAPIVPGTVSPELAAKGVQPDINSLTPQMAARASKAQPAVAALLGLYGDPQNPSVKSIADFASLANSPHAQRTLGAAFQLLNEKLGVVKDPGFLATLANAAGWENYKAEVEAQIQQRAGTAMTPQEREYFDFALAGLADIIGTRSATGQSAAKFSVNAIQNEFPLIGTSSVPDKNSYITKMQTVSRNVKLGLNSMPDNKRALAWLNQRGKELDLQKEKSSGGQQYKKGDSIKLKDGTTAIVVGYDKDGKLQVQ